MLYIKRNEENNMVVTVSEHKLLANPNYLFSFTHKLSKENVRFYPENVSTSTSRYDEFKFIEGDEPTGYTGTTPYVIFPFEGQYFYGVYEMVSNTNTNPSYAYNKLEEGQALVEAKSNDNEFTLYTSGNENNSNFIYYGENINPEVLTVELRDNIEQVATQGFRDIYPPMRVVNTYTNETFKVDPLSASTNVCSQVDEYNFDTYLSFYTGSTGSVTFDYEPADIITYGYKERTGATQGIKIKYTDFEYVSGDTYTAQRTFILVNGNEIVNTVTFDINGLITNLALVYPLEADPTISCNPTPTPTPTPSVTPTYTPTPTSTPGPTRTSTPGATATPTPTNSVTPSVTPTYTPTATITPSATPNFFRILTEGGDDIVTEGGDKLLQEAAP